MGKYAHFEYIAPSNFLSLYTRHAEITRDIHQEALREFTGDNTLTVDLVKKSPLDASKEVLEKLSEYDSVSCSSGLSVTLSTTKDGHPLTNPENVANVHDFCAENEMPIYTVAAGNDGAINTDLYQPRVADFIKNSLVVGEANVSKNGAYIEEDSSVTNPTLTCENPSDNSARRYQWINPAPSIKGFEKEAVLYLSNHHPLKLEELLKLVESKPSEQRYQTAIDLLKDPKNLHNLVLEDLRKEHPEWNLDDKGYATNISGTSLSAPRMAGFISGALHEQELREAKGLPTLTKEEITSIAKMSTFDTNIREELKHGIEHTKTTVDERANLAGNRLTQAGGHGVFSKEMFREMLDTAYRTIEKNPDINRNPASVCITTKLNKDGTSNDIDINNTNSDIIIDRINYKFEAHAILPRDMVQTMDRDNDPYTRDYIRMSKMQTAMESIEFYDKNTPTYNKSISWQRSEEHFGETLKTGEKWTIGLPNIKYGDGKVKSAEDITSGIEEPLTNFITLDQIGLSRIKDEDGKVKSFEGITADITVYGYEKGGLIDQMMKHSQKIAPNYSPLPSNESNISQETQLQSSPNTEPPAQPSTSLM